MSNPSKLHFQEKIPSFIRKTYEILEENRFPDIIGWGKDEKSIVISKPADFASQVLPLYFKHNHLTSFVRQLHMYNFHKRRSVGNDHIYFHELFQKNKKYLLKNIRKKKSEQNQDQLSNSSSHGMDNVKRFGHHEDSACLAGENENLKKLHDEALSKINSLEEKIRHLTQQNQSLRSQISPLQMEEKGFSSSQFSSYNYSTNSFHKQEPSLLISAKNPSQSFFNLSDEFQSSKLDAAFAELPDFCNFLNCEEQFGDCVETASQSYISSQLSPNDNYDSKGYFGQQNVQTSFFEEKAEIKELSVKTLQTQSKPTSEGIKITFGAWSLESNNFRMLPVGESQTLGLQQNNLLCKREFQENEADNYELENEDNFFSRLNKPRKMFHSSSQNYFETAPESMRIF